MVPLQKNRSDTAFVYDASNNPSKWPRCIQLAWLIVDVEDIFQHLHHTRVPKVWPFPEFRHLVPFGIERIGASSGLRSVEVRVNDCEVLE